MQNHATVKMELFIRMAFRPAWPVFESQKVNTTEISVVATATLKCADLHNHGKCDVADLVSKPADLHLRLHTAYKRRFAFRPRCIGFSTPLSGSLHLTNTFYKLLT